MTAYSRLIAHAAGAILLLANLQVAAAAEHSDENASTETFSPEPLFAHGRFETALTSGVLFSPFIAYANRPTVNYSITGVQLGYMLDDVKGEGLLRGNFEVAGEGFGSGIFKGPGGYIAGGTLWLRYNFVPQWSLGLIPYAQAGAGMVSTDLDHSFVGQPFNFNLDLGLGARYFVARNWSLSLEYRYQHISNADMGVHNFGVNAEGAILGVSYFF